MQGLREEGRVSAGLLATSLSLGSSPMREEALKLQRQTCSRPAADGGWRAEMGILPVLSGMSEETKSRASREFRLVCALGLIRWEETWHPRHQLWHLGSPRRAVGAQHSPQGP